MNPSSGESAPHAIMSRSESSREVSVTTWSDSMPSGRSPLLLTRRPPWGLMRRSSAATVVMPFPNPGSPKARLGRADANLHRSDYLPEVANGHARTARMPGFPRVECAALHPKSCRHLRADEAELFEPRDDQPRAFLGLVFLGVDHDL